MTEIIQEETGASVKGFFNGSDLLAEFQKNPEKYGLILLDISMPVMNGTDCMMEIRKINGSIPIYALSAYAILGNEKEFVNLGFTGHIPKPIDLDRLFGIIQSHQEAQ